MRYLVVILYVLVIMLITTFCGDPMQAGTPSNLLDLKAQNTAEIAQAYANMADASECHDWAATRRYQAEILRLHQENKELHRLYEISSPRRHDDDDDDPCGGAIADLQEMNNETATDAADDNLFQSAIRLLWFGVLVRLSLWLCWFLEWLLGWIPVFGLLIGIVLVLVAFLVMVGRGWSSRHHSVYLSESLRRI